MEEKCNINVCDGIKTWKIQQTESSLTQSTFTGMLRSNAIKHLVRRRRRFAVERIKTMNFVVVVASFFFISFVRSRSPLSKVDIKFLWKCLFRFSFTMSSPHSFIFIRHLSFFFSFLFYLSFNIRFSYSRPRSSLNAWFAFISSSTSSSFNGEGLKTLSRKFDDKKKESTDDVKESHRLFRSWMWMNDVGTKIVKNMLHFHGGCDCGAADLTSTKRKLWNERGKKGEMSVEENESDSAWDLKDNVNIGSIRTKWNEKMTTQMYDKRRRKGAR